MDPIGTPPGPPPGTPDRAAAGPAGGKAKAVAQGFVAVFLTEMVDEMMKTVKTGALDGGKAEDTWRSFLSQAMAEQIARSGATGIAQPVERMLAAYDRQQRAGGTADGQG